MICILCRRDVGAVPAIKVKSSFKQGEVVRDLVFPWHLDGNSAKCPASYLTIAKARALGRAG